MMGSNDLTYIAKGKRTKRQRPQSPIFLAMTTSSSNSGPGGGSGGGGGGGGTGGGYDQNSFSPTSSTTGFTESTEEEEDMANCLILLAKGGHSRDENSKRIEEIGTGNVERFNSRRFTEASATTTGKGGFYVYECKTCNRCFPSFQALGGHRASHKKPKNMAAEDQKIKPLPPLVLSSEDEAQLLPIQISSNIRTSSIGGNTINNNKSKVHECSICGSEFSSGQALGGHMRRHRTTSTSTSTSTTTAAATTIINNPVTVMSDESDHQEPKQKSRNLLSLDLNLPAPSEDDREGKFSFGSKQSLVFSASALVDCHY
ncbi:zinc finger protein [Macleaya cordata]|uniref:Zinc finger protein n=1 Tax=Macleaya cordata TaxID=56857 RepID=A0A200R5F9_MACCD|nr:zinc finger protein [Macleaya cordata]